MNTEDLPILRGDGTWPWHAHVDGDDIIVVDVSATCFGGGNDPMDDGQTASGINTKQRPSLAGCALPMCYTGSNKALKKALGGSPIPLMPYLKTVVEVTHIQSGTKITVPLIDRGPAKWTKDAIDLTIAAARKFDKKATANNFCAGVHYRILGGAKYLTKGSVS